MNHLKSFLLVALIVVCTVIKVNAQSGVAINTTGNSADASAMLDVSSTSKGFLLPRLTTTQRDLISLPATGLAIYNTSLNALQVNIGTPASPIWSTLSTSGSGWSLTGNSGTNSASNFLGTTDNVGLAFRTNNVERIMIDNAGRVGVGTSSPTSAMHIVPASGTTPLTIMGVAAGTTNSTDSVLTISSGVVKKLPVSTFNTSTSYWGLSGNSGITASNFLGTTNNIGLNFRTNNVQRMTIDNTGNVGIGITSPTSLLHIVAPSGSNPLNLTGVATGSNTDSLLTIINGVVKKISSSALTSSTTSWLVTGNSGLVDNSTNYLGTNDNVPINFKAYGQKAGRIDAANTFFGAYSGYSNSNATTLNTGIGWHALFSNTTGTRNAALGYGALQNNTGSDNIGIGYAAETNGTSNSIAIGSNAYITGASGIAIGASSQAATNAYATAIGANSYANGTSSIAIGSGSGAASNKTQAQGATSIAVGFNAYSGATNNISLGSNSNTPSGTSAIAIGTGAYSGNTNSVSMGTNSSTTANNTVAIGNSAAAYSASSMGLGDGAKGNAVNATAIGPLSTANNSNSTAIGYKAIANANDAIVLGDATNTAVNIGIGTAIPNYKLQVVAPSNPLFLGGVQAGTTSDSILTIANGLVKKLPATSFASPTTAWMLGGNSLTSSGSEFLGTTNNTSLRIRTNNSQQMIVDSTGRVGIGTDDFNDYNPAKLLVEYGTTTSNTIANFKGSINDYLQLQVKNSSTGVNASTDIVATGSDSAYYIDMGINGSGYTTADNNFGGPNDGYLYVSGRNFLLGTEKANTDVIFLSGGGSIATNASLRIEGSTRNIIVGRGEATGNPIGNIIRAPNAKASSNNTGGGSLTLQGGSASTTATGGSVNVNGGASPSGSYGSVNISAGINSPVNIGSGTNTQNVTIGGANNNILLPKFTTIGGLIYTAAATGQIGSITPGTSGFILQSNGAGSAPSWVSTAGLNTNGWLLGGNNVTTTQTLGTTSNFDLPFITNNTEQMRLTKTGWLGIGTNNPQGTFHVVADNSEFGDDYFFEDYGTATTQGLYFRKARGTAAAPANLAYGDLISWIRFAPRTGGSFPFNNNAGFGAYYKGNGTTDLEDLRFYTSSAEQMRIDEFGNVGINKTNPTEILDVAGNIRFSGALMPNNIAGTSGYVLKSNGANNAPTWVDVNTLVTASASSGWNLTGNSATAASFLGTTNGQPLVLKVNNVQAGYIGLAGSSYATSLGVSSSAGFKSTAIGAGADAGLNNEATAIGYSASASGYQSIAIGSSSNTTATNQAIAIGFNSNTSSYQGIAIGASASATLSNAAMAVGNSASAAGYQSMAVGNNASTALLASNSIAIGNGVSASNANEMAFGNSTNNTIRFSGAAYNINRALIVGTNNTNGNGAYLTNGGTWTNASDINLKEDFSQLSGAELLAKISRLNITRWKYKGTNEYHIGPMAQDFFGLFNVGTDNKHISTIDPSGVALAAIKALNEKVDQQQSEIDMLIHEVKALKEALKKQ